jgi:hypothetical protein
VAGLCHKGICFFTFAPDRKRRTEREDAATARANWSRHSTCNTHSNSKVRGLEGIYIYMYIHIFTSRSPLARTGHVTQPATHYTTLTLKTFMKDVVRTHMGTARRQDVHAHRVSQSIIHNPWHISSCTRAGEVRQCCSTEPVGARAAMG